ncbi:phosphate/phosphite/phosphonate ABC transporter substrate-binding protein [Desulfurivibrio sp. D14AmB]|uniref:phosphate/phosphite/phosphonate ABC transporter substrate-binding protein n=1 Tax=Desulfurivibrio sp. D14AmB TaxID=3374370 RepID=UPI00376F2EFB
MELVVIGKLSIILLAGALTPCLLLLSAFSSTAAADNTLSQSTAARQKLTWAVFAYLGIEKTTQQYQPIVAYLNRRLTDHEVELRVLPMAEIFAGIEAGSFELVTTNPTHFLVVRRMFPLSGVVATLMNLDSAGKVQSRLSGAIVVRSDRSDLNTLADLRNQRIAAPSQEHMGGYRAQAYELHLAGVNLPEDVNFLRFTGVHQEAIRTLLSNEVDVAFVRSGVLEEMVALSVHPCGLPAPDRNPGGRLDRYPAKTAKGPGQLRQGDRGRQPSPGPPGPGQKPDLKLLGRADGSRPVPWRSGPHSPDSAQSGGQRP